MATFDTPEDIANNVLLHYELAGIARARLWVQNKFRELAKRRQWSWKIARGQFIFPTVYNTGTVTTTLGSDIVTGIGTVWDTTLIGRQFRISNLSAPATIINVLSTTSLQLDKPWGAVPQTAVGYEIYQAYVTVPDNFESFISVINPQAGYQLYLGAEARELDQIDPQRSSGGDPYVIASADYAVVGNGTVSSIIQAHGSGSVPTSGGVYGGVNDTVFTVEVTGTGDSGVATFKWKKDSQSTTSGVLTDVNGNSLQDGVVVFWPTGANYVNGDVFTIIVKAQVAGISPRYEVWPHVKTALVLPYIYEAATSDIFEPGFVLPRTLSGEVLLEGALSEMALWPGLDMEKQKNPFYDPKLAEVHQTRFERACERLEQKDDNIYPQDVTYYRQMPYFAGWGMMGADFWQKHA